MSFDLTRYWYKPALHPVTVSLLPFSWLFRMGTSLRRWSYRAGILPTARFQVPVIVVGNITVGGTGKTPLVIWLAQFLSSQGYRPGIVSRGVGGTQGVKPYRVKASDSPAVVGDEALLLSQATQCPMVICHDRAAAVRELLQQTTCNIVISDDGLQHYHLGRDIEIALLDSARGTGNHCLLPAGPLREPVTRLKQVDFVIEHGGPTDSLSMTLEPIEFVSLTNPQNSIPFSAFQRQPIHAIAGIGHPQRFFTMLTQAGFDVTAHPFPDHYRYQPDNFKFTDSCPIVMTEKDAVKCQSWADDRYWHVKVVAKLSEAFGKNLLSKLTHLEVQHES